jgi:hypothetical protein
MNWSKVLIGGVVAGVAVNVTEWVLHGMVMRSTYEKYSDVFRQDQANPLFFLLAAICVSFAAAILFSKTRGCWSGGFKGGATFGGFLGLFGFFTFFYNPLVFDGYPYYLAWCQGSITLIALVIAGGVLGLLIKEN